MSNVSQLLLRAAVALVLLLVCLPRCARRPGASCASADSLCVALGCRALVVARAVATDARPAGRHRRAVRRALRSRAWLRRRPGSGTVCDDRGTDAGDAGGYGAAAHRRPAARARACLRSSAWPSFSKPRPIPFLVNGIDAAARIRDAGRASYRPARAPAVYREMARAVPTDSVLVELPSAMPTSTCARCTTPPCTGARSSTATAGSSPPHYGLLTSALSEMPRHPDSRCRRCAKRRDARDRPRGRLSRHRRTPKRPPLLRSARRRRDIPRRF